MGQRRRDIWAGSPCKDFLDPRRNVNPPMKRFPKIKELKWLDDYPQVTRDDVLSLRPASGAVEQTPLIEPRFAGAVWLSAMPADRRIVQAEGAPTADAAGGRSGRGASSPFRRAITPRAWPSPPNGWESQRPSSCRPERRN
jgi:hypothetical protein